MYVCIAVDGLACCLLSVLLMYSMCSILFRYCHGGYSCDHITWFKFKLGLSIHCHLSNGSHALSTFPSKSQEGGKPYIHVKYGDEEKVFVCISPPLFANLYQCFFVLVMSVLKMKETYLGILVTNSVIAIPAYSNDSQKQVTKTMALNILQIIHKPTAAAITYGVDKKVVSKCSSSWT